MVQTSGVLRKSYFYRVIVFTEFNNPYFIQKHVCSAYSSVTNAVQTVQCEVSQIKIRVQEYILKTASRTENKPLGNSLEEINGDHLDI